MLEAVELCQQIAGRELRWSLDEHNRVGDHRWWDQRQLGCTKELAYASPEKDSLRRRAQACGMTYRFGPSLGTGFLGPSGGWSPSAIRRTGAP
jgi:hypothetical protein